MSRTTQTTTLAIVVLLAVLLSLPLFVWSPFYLHLLIMIATYGVLALGLRLIYSVGYVSFAHAGFMAIGAYASALLTSLAGFPFWVSLPTAGVLSGIIGMVVGYPSLRVKGAYFFLVTFAFGNVVTVTLANFWSDYFGGPGGINVPQIGAISFPFGLTLDFLSKPPYYYLALGLLLVTLLFMYRIDNSRTGMTLKSIRESDVLANSLGINLSAYKVMAFGIACFFAGLAGSLWAHYTVHIDPGVFSFHLSVNLLLFMLIGGTATVFGPLLGVFVLVMLTPLFNAMGIAWEVLIYGVVLILVMIFLPDGFTGLGKYFKPWLQRLR